MHKILTEQLDLLKMYKFTVDGKISTEIPDDFDSIIFYKTGNSPTMQEKQIIFKDYMVKPFTGFDFNVKFNKGINPPLLVMFGEVIKESDKMYYIKVHAKEMLTTACTHCFTPGTVNLLCDNCKQLFKDINTIHWEGWVPKKSCTII